MKRILPLLLALSALPGAALPVRAQDTSPARICSVDTGSTELPAGFNPMAAFQAPLPAQNSVELVPNSPTAAEPAPAPEPAPEPISRVFRVKATAEGLIGGMTASGTRIQKWSEGAALPSRKGLKKVVGVTYLVNGRQSSCKVMDVGPWNIKDAYWEKAGGKPQAESGRDLSGRRTNRAGIDLYNATWYKLLALRAYDKRLIENTSGMVDWSFVK